VIQLRQEGEGEEALEKNKKLKCIFLSSLLRQENCSQLKKGDI
jgi:hypothetical protein